MERSSQLNPHATPFVPSFLAKSLKANKDPEKQVDGAEKNGTADKSAGYELPDSLSFDDYAESLGKVNISAESSSSKGEAAEASHADSHVAVVESLLLMFPDVSADSILEALKANDFDTDLTIDMLFDLCEADDDTHSAEASGNQQQLHHHHPPFIYIGGARTLQLHLISVFFTIETGCSGVQVLAAVKNLVRAKGNKYYVLGLNFRVEWLVCSFGVCLIVMCTFTGCTALLVVAV